MDCWKLVVGFSKPQLTIIWGGRDVRKLQSSTRDGRGWTLATSQLSCIRNDAFQEGHYSRYKMVAFVVPLVSFMDRVQHVADCPPNLHWALKVKVRRCVVTVYSTQNRNNFSVIGTKKERLWNWRQEFTPLKCALCCRWKGQRKRQYNGMKSNAWDNWGWDNINFTQEIESVTPFSFSTRHCLGLDHLHGTVSVGEAQNYFISSIKPWKFFTVLQSTINCHPYKRLHFFHPTKNPLYT